MTKKPLLLASTLIVASFAFANAEELTWNGSEGNNTWDTGTSGNWSGNSTTWSDNDNATFGSGGYTTVDVTSEGVTAGTITVNDDYTFTGGKITATTVTVTDSTDTGTTFSGEVSFGSLTISSGSLTLTGGGTIGALLFTGSDTENLTFSGEGKTYDITTIDVQDSNVEKLTVSEGATVNSGTLTVDWHVNTVAVDGVLNISGTVELGVSASNPVNFTGAGTVTVGSLKIGHYSNAAFGGAIKIDGGLTFVANEITIGSGSSHSVEIGNATFGTSNADGLTFSSSITSFTLNAASGEATTFNTSLYDVENAKFTDTGTTITIATNITGGGDMIVTGNGELDLTGSSNALGGITVSSGKLSISNGTTTISGTTSVAAGASLSLSGTVTLGTTIENAGSITLDSSMTFVLDNIVSEGDIYTVISGSGDASITLTGGDLTYGNFTLNGDTLSSRAVVDTSNGSLIITYAAGNLIWNGSANDVWTTNGGAVWTNSAGGTETFVEKDNVTFDTHSQETSQTVNISGSFEAGTITVNDDYTFVFANGSRLEAKYVDVTSTEYTLKLELASGASSAEFHMDSEDFGQLASNGENHGNIEIGEGVTFYVSTGTGSASYTSSSVSITGTGILSVGSTAELGLYLPDFQGTVLFREGTTARLAKDSVYNEKATLSFENGTGLKMMANGTIANNLEFADGSQTLNSNGFDAEFTGTISAANSTLTKSGNGTITLSGSGTINNLTAGGGTLVIAGTELNITTLTVTGGTATFSGGTDGEKSYTLTEIATGGDNGTLTIAENATVNATNFTSNWAWSSIEVNGVLNISDTMSFGQNGATSNFTGTGTVIANTLRLSHPTNPGNGGAVKIDGGLTFIAGTVSDGNSANHYIEFGNATFGTSSDSVTFDSGINSFVLSAESGSTTTFNTNKYDTTNNSFSDTGTTITIAAVVSGEGSMTVTGNGSLTLSGTNTSFSGGVVIDAGKVVAANNSALGTGTVTISNGGTLEINSDVTISNNITIILSEANISDSTSPTSLVVNYAADISDVYALIGNGTIADSVTITITVDEAVKALLAEGDTYIFDIYDGVSLSEGVTIDYSALTAAGYTVDRNTGQLIVQGLPEPELFSIFFGLGAIGLVATRRRRRRA